MSQIYQAIVSLALAIGPSLLMLAAFALLLGGIRLMIRGNRQKGVLMVVCAVVFVANVAILTL